MKTGRDMGRSFGIMIEWHPSLFTEEQRFGKKENVYQSIIRSRNIISIIQ
jgi:hypothetical protein